MDKFEFDKTVEKLQAIKYDLPTKLANIAQNYFVHSFYTDSWDGKSWQEVQRRIAGTDAYKYPIGRDEARHKRGILIGKTRDLIDSVRHSIRSVSWEQIVLGTDVPYAVYHNEGTATIPKRQFMGESSQLQVLLMAEVKKALKIVFGK